MRYHLSHLPEVQAAIAAAEACDTIAQLQDAVRAFKAHPVCMTEAMPGHAGESCHGPNPAMLLGKSPAGTEVQTRVPFSGPAGQVLREEMRNAGMEAEDCWITCATPWRPRKGNTPNATQLAVSRPFLYREIQLVRPAVILALGEKAVEGLFQEHVYTVDLAGTEMTLDLDGERYPVRVLLNHAFVMYGRAERSPMFRRHLRAAADAHPEAFTGSERRMAA